KHVVDTTIRPCLSTADAIRSDVNQESSVEASPLHGKTQHECTSERCSASKITKSSEDIEINKFLDSKDKKKVRKLIQNSDLSTVAISSSFVTLHESEQSDELIFSLEKNLIVEQKLMQQLSFQRKAYLHCTNLKEPGISLDKVLEAYPENSKLIQELRT
ncbi:10084_t:CDS:2, partial [Cetraspora pellucida]